MKDKIKSVIKKYTITTAIGASITVLTMYLRNFATETDLAERYRILADAFSISGVVMIMVWCMVAVSTTGFFDMISYSLSSLGRALIPFYNKERERYYDYKTRKNSERFSNYGFILVVGVVFTSVALIFTALFYTI